LADYIEYKKGIKNCARENSMPTGGKRGFLPKLFAEGFVFFEIN
jgi:hypothetical protein